MYDCLITGAGVVGLSLAYELAQSGIEVRIIDRGEPGREASWAGAGILPAGNTATATNSFEQLGGLSSQLHLNWSKQLREETKIDNGYRRCGGIHVARKAADRVALLNCLQYYTTHNIRHESLTSAELVEHVPCLAGPTSRNEIQESCYVPDNAQLRNPRHLKALLAACQAKGVEVSSQVELLGFETSGQRITAALTSTGPIYADQYCVTSGAWTKPLVEPLGWSPSLKPIRGQMVLFQAPDQLFLPVINEASRYLVPRDDGRILAGSTEEDVGFHKETTVEAIANLVSFACSLVDRLKTVPVEQAWAGLRPSTPDRLPYLGRVADWDNLSVAAGHFRDGLWLSTGTAKVMSQLIQGKTPCCDLSDFALDRVIAPTIHQNNT